jgi:hypothetical protein
MKNFKDFKDFKDCPIGEYVRIIKRVNNPVDTFTDEELWILYTKAKVDAASGYSKDYLNRFEAELINRGILAASQTSFFEGK